MLPEKPWTADAILRLFARVLVCVVLGSLLSSALAVVGGPRHPHTARFLVLVAATFGFFLGALFILGRPWRLETFTRNLIALAVCFYGGLGLTWWLMRSSDFPTGAESSPATVLIAVLSFEGAACALICRFLREQRIGWTEAFGFDIEWKRALWLGALAAVVFLCVGLLLQSVSVQVLERLHLQAKEQTVVEVLQTSGSWPNRLVIGAAAILLAPLAEEMLFRGILYPAIKQAGFPRLALWGTALAFGAVHVNLASFVPLTVLALLLTWLYEKTGNLLAPIVTHSLFNALNFVLLYVSESLHLPHAKP